MNEKSGTKEALIKLKKKTKKSITEDRLRYRIENFEEELWSDIKSAKASYLPKHIKLRKENGEVAKTSRRNEILADCVEKK